MHVAQAPPQAADAARALAATTLALCQHPAATVATAPTTHTTTTSKPGLRACRQRHHSAGGQHHRRGELGRGHRAQNLPDGIGGARAGQQP